jgi:hypothetical protein
MWYYKTTFRRDASREATGGWGGTGQDFVFGLLSTEFRCVS